VGVDGFFDFFLSFLAFFVDLAKARLQHTPPTFNDNESFISAACGTLVNLYGRKNQVGNFGNATCSPYLLSGKESFRHGPSMEPTCPLMILLRCLQFRINLCFQDVFKWSLSADQAPYCLACGAKYMVSLDSSPQPANPHSRQMTSTSMTVLNLV
jgi:hypothetical protein